MSTEYDRFNPGSQKHRELLENAKNYLHSLDSDQVWEKQVAWTLCKPGDYPLEEAKNHEEIEVEDIPEEYRTTYPHKSIRNILRGGLRQHLEQEENLIEIFTDERGGQPAVIYQLAGDTF